MTRYINFPQNRHELEELRAQFYRKYQFPRIIGIIDCTHIAIVRPNEDEHVYVNRKNYHSLNVQLVCDYNLKIINVNARYPGSTHDSQLSGTMQDIRSNYQQSFFLLADLGYPLRPWLFTPYRDAVPNTAEYRCNQGLITIRSLIERCNGVLKNRFRCLLRQRVLHYSPENAAKIINSCVILHNMCIKHNVAEPPHVNVGIDLDFGLYPEIAEGFEGRQILNVDLIEGRTLRDRIAQMHFN